MGLLTPTFLLAKEAIGLMTMLSPLKRLSLTETGASVVPS